MTRDARTALARFRKTFRGTLFIVGPVFLAIALGLALNTWLFLRRGTPTVGKIVDMVSKRDGQGGTLMSAPVFVFTAGDGRSYKVTSEVFSYPPEYVVGQDVAVLYEMGNPMRARLSSFMQLWFVPSGFGFAGALAVAVAYFILLYERRHLVQH